ncbi:hypothetical protein KKF55_03055 [Patescibacteria group bacterium]|nr:hypothetical protein [Patescibacteria group bacterium]
MKLDHSYFTEATLAKRKGQITTPREVHIGEILKQISYRQLTLRISCLNLFGHDGTLSAVPLDLREQIGYIENHTTNDDHIRAPWTELLPKPPPGGTSLLDSERLYRDVLLRLMSMTKTNTIILTLTDFSKTAVDMHNAAAMLSSDVEDRTGVVRGNLYYAVLSAVLETLNEEKILSSRVPMVHIDSRQTPDPILTQIIMQQGPIIARRVCRALKCEEIALPRKN